MSAGYGAVPVVRSLSLTVGRGEIVALLGANGAGKTTALLSLAGELATTEGSVRWNGTELTTPLHRRARQGMRFVTEERSVFMNMTVAENLRLGKGAPEHAIDLFPELKRLLKRKAGLLSGGEQQMLTLGRALSSCPDILLADELSLGLAPIVVERLFEALRQAASQGLGVLLVEQQVTRALSVADRAYVMRRGEVAMSGTSAEMQGRIDEIEKSYLASAS